MVFALSTMLLSPLHTLNIVSERPLSKRFPHIINYRKIAIVDIDVHHGNGTQEIVECLKPK